MTTFVPRPEYTDAELAGLYPPDLRLQQVQILLRHGERTPVNTRFANAGVPAFWPYCKGLNLLRAAVLDPATGRFSELQWKTHLETFGRNDEAVSASGPAGEYDALCGPGMLTDRGRETTFALGSRLRRLYVERLGFLPAKFDNAQDFYLRATPIPRALESMQQAFHGLYPPHTRPSDPPPLTIVSRSPADETLFPNDADCRRFAELSRAFAQRAANRWNNSEDMAYLNDKIGKWMPPNSPRVAVDSRPRLSGIMDSMNATNAHGPATRLPKEFYDPKVKQIIEKIGLEEWFAGYKESREYRILGIGGLLGDIVDRMVDSAQAGGGQNTSTKLRAAGPTTGAAPWRFGLSGCHDTTLAAILTSLGAMDTTSWPPFTSHIAVELFRSADQPPSQPPSSSGSGSGGWSSLFGRGTATPAMARKLSPDLSERDKKALQGYFVRIRYNDRPVTIPGCRIKGNHLDGDESFCTLEAFKSIVDKFTPHNWKQQCRTNIKSSAFPAKDEPAGY